MASKPRKVNYKKKAIQLAKQITRSKGFCERCGITGKQLQAAHILPEPFVVTCADLDNLLCLCAHCHRLGKLSWHQSPVHGVRWLEATYPGKIERLLKKTELPDFQAIYAQLLPG